MHRTRSSPLEACSNGGTSEKVALLVEEEPVKPSPEDPAELAAQASAALEASRRAFACRVVAGGLGVLFIVLLACQGLNSSTSPDTARSFSSHCLSSSGGGVVGPRGSLLHFDPSCTVELRVRPVSARATGGFERGGLGKPESAVGTAPGSAAQRSGVPCAADLSSDAHEP